MTEQERTVSIVIPEFGNRAHAKLCIDAVVAYFDCHNHLEVIAFDDNSDSALSETLSAAAAPHQDFHILQRDAGMEWASACNQGAKHASGEVLVFLNGATEPHDGWLNAGLRRLLLSPKAGVVGARVLYPEGDIMEGGIAFVESESTAIRIRPQQRFRYRDGDDPVANRSAPVFAVSGTCMFISRGLFKTLGGFDEVSGQYFKDIDLCLRAGRLGREVWYEPTCCLAHHGACSHGDPTALSTFEGTASRTFLATWEEHLSGQLEADDLFTYPPDDLIGYGARAARRGDVALARRSFERALHADPRNWQAHNGLAVLYWTRQDAPRALRHLATALDIAPAAAELNANALTILTHLGEYEAAERVQQHYTETGGADAVIQGWSPLFNATAGIGVFSEPKGE